MCGGIRFACVMRYTPESLLPAFQELFRRFTAEIGPNLSANLKARRVVKRHGSCNSVLMWKFWDRRQTEATLPPDYNGYGINYDPDRYETTNTDWALKLKFNTVRIYQGGVNVREYLCRELPLVCPKSFKWTDHPRELRMEWFFSFDGPVAKLPDKVLPRLVELFKATYPVVDSLMQQVESSIAIYNPEKLKTGKSRIYAPAAKGAEVQNRGALRHGISRSLRTAVLAEYGRKCAICGIPFNATDDIHIDHATSFAAGGLTVLENLRPTHGLCNLKKGSGKMIPKEHRIPAKIRNQNDSRPREQV